MLDQTKALCATCAGSARRFAGRYRDFLLDPGTLFTLTSLLLLLVASIQDPSGLVSRNAALQRSSPLYLAAALIGSVFIWWSAIQGIRHHDFTADIPVSIATAAALAIGQYSAAAVVAVLLLLGGMLENFVAARAGKALEALSKLLPDRVTVRSGDDDVVVPLEEVEVGDLLLIRPGERVAVDGEVVLGTAAVSQGAITGESLPLEKHIGDTVFAGTLNEHGTIEVRATKVGQETTLGQIRRMVEEAQEKKAPIERMLNRYAKFYTPAAVLLGALLWWWSGDITRAITMLIVFCPCVMVLATPTALVASIGNAALRGTLVKKGATIEALAKVDTVVFDKTGTLTYGQPRLVRVVPLNGLGETEVLRLAAVAEKFSEHPLARAVVHAAHARSLHIPDPEDFEPLPGMGVRSSTEGRMLLLGRLQLLSERGLNLPSDVELRAEELAAPGRTVIGISNGREVAGLLALEDVVREDAQAAVMRLNALGVQTVLVTGDNWATAEQIAAQLGISEVYAETLPQQKVEVVKRLQAEGRLVAFVGDGVNDGPALATSDVGIAMGLAGTDVAIETAEIALLADDLSKLPHLLELSRQAIRAIKQNLVFSLGVLGAAVGLTIPGLLNPVSGALLHELSSIPVIANSARLIGLRERVDRTPGVRAYR
jgi:Zn2+/Cd2+-exporting ATPase